MGSPWPSHGQANRNQGPRDTGIYGRLGADHLGRKTHNSYIKRINRDISVHPKGCSYIIN